MATFLSRPSTAPAATDVEVDSDDSNMKVVVRVRPENENELRGSHQPVVKVLDDHVLVFDPNSDNAPSFDVAPVHCRAKRPPFLTKKHKNMSFAFDRVFDETASQMDVFDNVTRSIIDGVLNGINCSVFAYGATGAGKTYTMLGNPENPGVMFLTMMELYRRINELRDEKTCDIAISYCEIYNETIKDLLVPSGPLHLREDSNKGLVVSGLSRHKPKSAEDILKMLEIGNLQRTQHPTDANATSSRSHAILQVFVHQQARTAGLSAKVTQAKMSLIDLAGSERATVTTNSGERLREGANINKSLLALGNCINALADKGKAMHVPYRNSKLTRLLKDSLGGNCRTVMIANVSPSGLNFDDTYNTLKYADRAKQIKTKLIRNVVNVDFHVTKYRAIVQDLQNEIAELKDKLERKTPRRQPFDVTEAARLQGLIQGVYGERLRLRKHMAELDASERETLLKVCRKERDIGRISAISCNEDKKAKLSLRVEALRQHVVDIQRKKQTVNEYLYSNNETIGRIQAEVSATSIGKSGSLVLQQLLESVTEAKKFETENAHKWKQIKHLLKYVKNQEKEITKTERMLTIALEVVRQQHAMLRSCNGVTPNLRRAYEALVRMAEGDKEVAWADESAPDADVNPMDVSSLAFTHSQQTLFDSFVMHPSPMQRCVPSEACPPVSASPNVVPSSISILNCSAFQVADPNSTLQQTPAASTQRHSGTGPSSVHAPNVAPPNSHLPEEHTPSSAHYQTPKSSIFSLPGIRSKFSRSRSPAIAHNSSGSNNITTHAIPKGVVSSSSRPQPQTAPERTTPPANPPRRSAFVTKFPDAKAATPKISSDSSSIKSGSDINYVQLYKLSAERNAGCKVSGNIRGAPALPGEGRGAVAQGSSVQDLWKKPTPQKNGMLASSPYLNGSKASLFKIPNKPRVPTPIDNYSSSSASCVTYNTRLNTMLNSKRKQEVPAVIANMNTSQLRSIERNHLQGVAADYSLPSQMKATPRNSISDSSCTKSTSTLVSANPPSTSDSYSDKLSLVRNGNAPRAANRTSRSPPSSASTPSSNNFCGFEDNFTSPNMFKPVHHHHHQLQQQPPSPPQPAATLLCRPQSSHVGTTTNVTTPTQKSPSSRSLAIGLSSISSAFKRIGIGHSTTRSIPTAQVSPHVSQHAVQQPHYLVPQSRNTSHKSQPAFPNNTYKTRNAFAKTRPVSQILPHQGNIKDMAEGQTRVPGSPLPSEHDLNTTFTVGSDVRAPVSHHRRAAGKQEDQKINVAAVTMAGGGVVEHNVSVCRGGHDGGNPLVTLHVNTVTQEKQRAPNAARNGLNVSHIGIPMSKQLQRPQPQKQGTEQENPRKLPSYLQMTKSAASKRVLRLNNKENKHQQQTKSSIVGRLKARKFQDVANKSCNGGVTISAPGQTQLVW